MEKISGTTGQTAQAYPTNVSKRVLSGSMLQAHETSSSHSTLLPLCHGPDARQTREAYKKHHPRKIDRRSPHKQMLLLLLLLISLVHLLGNILLYLLPINPLLLSFIAHLSITPGESHSSNVPRTARFHSRPAQKYEPHPTALMPCFRVHSLSTL